MKDFLSGFKLLIRQAFYDNTYKMAWAKALVELSAGKDTDAEEVVITLDEIALPMLKYYWNQTIFFDLIQGSDPLRPPVILQLVKELIATYRLLVDDPKPIAFTRALDVLEKQAPKKMKSIIARTVRTLKENVSYRFLRLEGEVHEEVYRYVRNADRLFMRSEDVRALKANQDDLFDLINYRWSLILETFNSSPRINKKVRITDLKGMIPRSNLKRFDEYLDLENGQHICFICGKPIEDEELARDHVIPWSYLYSDDLWNIVYVHRRCNSRKSSTVPDPSCIERLKARNLRLREEIRAYLWSVKAIRANKVSQDLELAIDRDYVDQFYIGCRQ